jgi:competence protein ComFC
MKSNSTAVFKRQQFSYQWSTWIWNILDWVFPPDCPGCESSGVRFCEKCRGSVQPLPEPICPVCGEPGKTEGLCSDCLSEPPAFDALRAYTLFDGKIRNALHRLKYRDDISLGDVLAPFLVDLYTHNNWPVDLVTAVPLSKNRYRSRGYNQAEQIALPFAVRINKPYFANAIQRVVDTQSQIDLSLTERRENVSGAFYANTMVVGLKSVIIIDDVSTTGSTLSECARALKEAGADKVYALTIARAPLSGTRGGSR